MKNIKIGHYNQWQHVLPSRVGGSWASAKPRHTLGSLESGKLSQYNVWGHAYQKISMNIEQRDLKAEKRYSGYIWILT